MVSWAIVGATRGIGSGNSQNTVVALIRSQSTAGPLNQLAASRKNIHVVETDISKSSQLKETAKKVGSLIGGKLDVLIYNAYSAGTEAATLPPSAFADKEDDLEREIFDGIRVNTLQLAFTVNAFLPLIRQSELKKIVYITSGFGDHNVTRVCETPALLGYCVSKASGNMLMAKYAAELKQEGIKTLSLSPGWVGTDGAKKVTETPELFEYLLSSFQKYDPSVKGMITTPDSVREQLAVIDSLDASNSGKFLSHHGGLDDWF
ncbi:MAG: hypothetical protein M1820_004347 [Bogoriella megaspora]|nr:MAG: hypothetical protein M1820_004347 [Bogoriella megaspora]